MQKARVVWHGIAGPALLVLACLALLGCATARDTESLVALEQNNKGVVFLSVHFPDQSCWPTNFVMAVDAGDHFKGVLIAKPGTPIKLDAGEYHLVSVRCFGGVVRGRQVYKKLEKQEMGLFNSPFYESYAKIKVLEGQVVSAGVVGFHMKFDSVYRVEVRDYSSSDKEALLKEYPNLFSKASVHLMDAKLRKPGQS